jgi:hypothetical protein
MDGKFNSRKKYQAFILRMKLAALLFCCTSCAYWDIYEIKQNRHYSSHECISFYDGSVLRFNAKFAKSCLYDIDKTDGEGDLNKLYGFTDCRSTIHQNSVRFAWRHDGQGNIEIFGYLYVDGIRNFFPMGITIPGRVDSYELHAEADRYYLRFNNTDTTLARSKTCSSERMKSFPYFGGSMPAPNTMHLYIHQFRLMRTEKKDPEEYLENLYRFAK